ncbi:Phosphatidylinositol 4-phosphate 3-kinase C2 domain-containing subunit [Seminavis robusta]|uniref:Phosphatidylinositol 4-phosphate 3-kinase C2 domain-containing subunit n=1 Tax=Seminavis robusta TaxID=568900 RepID=A0A9N8E376_9STRA|nr:Phosphatidylinositol 4-phosphate 3-kinase C2 domain-containing subunit [Seminavis robusta]|eukprot:Sro480_g151400.1 Phosphatidylinositol 4-phosphate 3-kinase C2 domain-containing subunit (684) ;mRNA; r:33837-35888
MSAAATIAEDDVLDSVECTYTATDGIHVSEFLEAALSSSGVDFPMTPQTLLALSDEHLIKYCLLIMSLLGKLGSSTAATSQPDGAANFEALLDAFCLRISSSRVLKLRAGLLAHVTDLGMAESWKPAVTFDPDCYQHAQQQLQHPQQQLLLPRASGLQSVQSTDTVGSSSSTVARGLLDDPEQLQRYVSRNFFHPRNGIHLKTKRRNLLQAYPNSFSEKLAVLFLVQDLHCDRKTASVVGQAMLDRGLIKRVYGGKPSITSTITGSLRASQSNGDSKFGQGDSIFVRAMNKQSSVKALASQNKVDLTLGLDIIDLQSIRFWRTGIWEKAPFKEGSHFDSVTVVHPMATSLPEEDQQQQDNQRQISHDHGGCLVQSIKVTKVFQSMAKPAFLSLAAFQPGELIDPPSLVEIGPKVIAKGGDNLLNDASVELLFRIFTHVWCMDAERFADDGSAKPPFAFDYDVIPCGHRVGLLGVLPGLEPLNDFDWKAWATKYNNNAEVLDNMCRSAAGCSIATFVLGCGDRHWDNIQIQNDTTMLHIDFGMILGENPAFKTPRFSISAGQEAAFKEVGIWERFVKLCGLAFLSLRARAPELMQVTALLLQHAGRPQSKILKYLASIESFNISEEDQAKAESIVCKQVRQSSTHWETIARKFTHDRIDPLFFRAVERAPAGLVAAVEKMYDKN